MKKTSLCGKWRMIGNGYDVEGEVPGSVYSFLLDAKKVPDPYYRDNEFQFLEIAEHEYSFSKKFKCEKNNNPKFLVCEGLDTVCEIFINGNFVGKAINMHVKYEFAINDYLIDGENEIRIDFASANRFIKEKIKTENLPAGWDALVGFSHIRKAHCMLGWDWGPRLPDAGIWKDIYLVERDLPQILSFTIDQRHENGKVYVLPNVVTDEECDLNIILTSPLGEQTILGNGVETEIINPLLWWPNNLGKQNLYSISAKIISDGKVVDEKRKRIGLRTLKLIREKDKWGEGFCHEVNGVRFFAMGADYIPEDNILSRITKERTGELIKQCKNSNFNAIRVWGGGYYVDDFFFDACDEAGIVVFFDLMFACASYNPDEETMQSIITEVKQNVGRIRDRASLALICGNNEVEQFFYNRLGNPDLEKYRLIYLKIFEDIFPNLIMDIAPSIPYISSSPITCGRFIATTSDDFGDQHFWDVWHKSSPIDTYRKKYCRYLSEFGFQGMSDYKTIKQYTEPCDRNISSKIMELHQRNRDGNGKILSAMEQNFLYPTSFETLVYASQILQAEAITSAIEHFRRNRGRCMGTLYWQLNDIWPVTSWASIDYYGRWKALQYCAKRYYAPITITCEETGIIQTRKYFIAEPNYYDYVTKAKIFVHNETLEKFNGRVKWRLANAKSTILKSGEQDVSVEPMSVFALEEIDFDKTDFEKNHVFFELISNGKVIASGSKLFVQHKHYAFENPNLCVIRKGDNVVIKSDAYAKYVNVYSNDEDFLLEDNFFDMEKGEKTIKILKGDPLKLSVRSVYDIR